MLQSWLAKRLVDWVFAGLRAKNIGRAMLLDGRDVVLRFPGENSWAGVHRGKEAHRRWEQRLVDVGLQIYADEVIAVGPPWRTTICVRGTDHLRSAEGELVYENRYVIWGKLRWGRMHEIEVYEDTEATARMDRWLEQHEPRLATA